MSELIVLVDDGNVPIGTAEKLSSHHANTPLHRGFSCYVFNDKGQVLVTQRALKKKVWPGVWTNTVCGHPGPDENVVDAINRRLDYELGMTAQDFEAILPDYRYKTPPFKGIIENELCPVYVARLTSQPQPNADEVEDLTWMTWDEYSEDLLADKGNKYSYWCKDQLAELRKNKKFLNWLKASA